MTRGTRTQPGSRFHSLLFGTSSQERLADTPHRPPLTVPLLKRLVWSRLSLSASSSSIREKYQKKEQTSILSHSQSGAQTALSVSAVWKWGRCVGVTSWPNGLRSAWRTDAHTSPPLHLKTQSRWNIQGSESNSTHA